MPLEEPPARSQIFPQFESKRMQAGGRVEWWLPASQRGEAKLRR